MDGLFRSDAPEKAIVKEGLRAGKNDNLEWVWYRLTRKRGKLYLCTEVRVCSSAECTLLTALQNAGKIVNRSTPIGRNGEVRRILACL